MPNHLVRRQVIQQLEMWSREAPDYIMDPVKAAPLVTVPKSVPTAPESSSEGDSLEKIASEIAACTACRLHEERTQVVPGEGACPALVMFVGEGPGVEEDRTGRPFVGPAGQLLDKIMASIGLSRENCFIGNVVKCRPPGNREPQPDEVEACSGFLRRQLALIKPKFLCSLGAHGTRGLLGKEYTAISRMRGNFYRHQGIPLLPTFHPAYLLRNPGDKRLVWEDMKKLKAALSIPECR